MRSARSPARLPGTRSQAGRSSDIRIAANIASQDWRFPIPSNPTFATPRDYGRLGPYALAACLLVSTASPAFAQANADPLVITGQRLVFGIVPERTLDEDYISGYGLGTVGELLEEVTAENGETPDEPVILVNGEPVAGLGEIEDYPP